MINVFCSRVKEENILALTLSINLGAIYSLKIEVHLSFIICHTAKTYVHVSGSTAPVSFNCSFRKSDVCELHTPLTSPTIQQPSLLIEYNFNLISKPI